MGMRRVFRSTVLALGAAGLLACQSTGGPGTGATPGTSSTRSVAEQRRGDAAHEQVVAQFGGEYRNARVQSYVEDIGRRIAAISEQPNARWTFTVLDSPTVNAFATPGGYVYVTRGLVALAEDEAQLAGVIGHEIGHVTAGHGAERQGRSTMAGLGLLLGAVGLSVLGADPSMAQSALQIGQMAAGGIVASYSRQDELEADRLGIRYLAQAGYDPYAQAEFLENMAAASALQAREQGKGYDPDRVDFLSTHPATAARTREAIEIARSAGEIGRGGERGRERHLQVVEGMTYGQSPEQGFVQGNTFVHPKLGFAYTAPRGFQLSNTPAAVIATGPSSTRLILDGGRDPGGPLERYVAQDWAGAIARQARTGRIEALDTLTIDGLPAARGILPVQVQGSVYDALLVAIRNDGQIYRFTGLAPQGSPAIGEMMQAAESFRQLGAADLRGVEARRIEVVTVRAGDTVESLGRRMAGERYPVDAFRVLNGLQPGEPLRAGQQVKIVM